MAKTYTGNMMAIHDVESYKVKQMVQELINKGSYCFPPIEVRRTQDNLLVVIDGVHRAVASCVMNVPAEYQEVGENELLNDSDISSRSLYLISGLAENCVA
jgi:ParB-like nuclease domain